MGRYVKLFPVLYFTHNTKTYWHSWSVCPKTPSNKQTTHPTTKHLPQTHPTVIKTLKEQPDLQNSAFGRTLPAELLGKSGYITDAELLKMQLHMLCPGRTTSATQLPNQPPCSIAPFTMFPFLSMSVIHCNLLCNFSCAKAPCSSLDICEYTLWRNFQECFLHLLLSKQKNPTEASKSTQSLQQSFQAIKSRISQPGSCSSLDPPWTVKATCQ